MCYTLIGSLIGLIVGGVGAVLTTYIAWVKGGGYGPSARWYLGSWAVYLTISIYLLNLFGLLK